jgi:hypothetical protein
VRSDAERTAGLDGELEASFREFEERMARERGRLAEQGVSAPAGGAVTGPATVGGSAAAESGEFGQHDPGGAGGPSAAPGEDGGAVTAGSPTEPIGGGAQGVQVPPDVGDGAGDDIVARQIREAAMSETDPELREKLWDEYRRYKKGGQAPGKSDVDDKAADGD